MTWLVANGQYTSVRKAVLSERGSHLIVSRNVSWQEPMKISIHVPDVDHRNQWKQMISGTIERCRLGTLRDPKHKPAEMELFGAILGPDASTESSSSFSPSASDEESSSKASSFVPFPYVRSLSRSSSLRSPQVDVSAA
eukprot:CAMPEP_0184654870 /NCGR_PEP_ID=MMETSP0308-20130426/12522_1 /TAXON_ID=38269 /ORGANISM="Gloeochaete witrockiana, Strain SAG 46.84" /LENGTH=138 /DNA_ID=CAMNT_0027091055 /DNA_START=442 /DNA_END=858 /DNA_ORIENTATION=-